jgi:hypothetical protein
MLDKIRLDDLDKVYFIFKFFFNFFFNFKIRTFPDYYSYLRGERIQTPPPEPQHVDRQSSLTPSRLASPLISQDLVLKGLLIIRVRRVIFNGPSLQINIFCKKKYLTI